MIVINARKTTTIYGIGKKEYSIYILSTEFIVDGQTRISETHAPGSVYGYIKRRIEEAEIPEDEYEIHIFEEGKELPEGVKPSWFEGQELFEE